MIFANNGVQGPDVSFWQDDNTTPQHINFTQMKQKGAYYVIIRAGQNQWTDEDFAINWKTAKDAGLLRGAYWFYDSRVRPEDQATQFANLFANDPPEMELWLDLEETYNGAYTGYANWKKFLNRLRMLLPDAKIGIYTGYYYILGKIPSSEYTYFSQFALWLAWYTKNSNGQYDPISRYVLIPQPWTSCLFWQWGTPPWGLEWGCESLEIDMNLYNGTVEQFQSRYGEVPTVPPGEIFMKFKVRSNSQTAGRTIRNGNGVTFSGIYTLPANTDGLGDFRFSYSAAYVPNQAYAGDRWIHLTSPVEGWIAEIHRGVRYLTVEEVPDPSPDPITTVTANLDIDGVKFSGNLTRI